MKRAGARRPGPPNPASYCLIANYVLALRPRQRPGLVIQTRDDGGVSTPAALDLVGHPVVARGQVVVAPAADQLILAGAAYDDVITLAALEGVSSIIASELVVASGPKDGVGFPATLG